jgi:hypothetical protein
MGVNIQGSSNSTSSGTNVQEIENYATEEIFRSNGMSVSVSFRRRNGYAEVSISKAVFGKMNFTKTLDIPKSAWVSLMQRIPKLFIDELAAQPAYLGAATNGMHFVQSPALILDLM